MRFLVGFSWFCVDECLKALHHSENMPSTLMVSLGRKKLGQHFPMKCSKIGHSYEAFTYLFGRNIAIRLLPANKYSPVDLSLKLAVTGNLSVGASQIASTTEVQHTNL